MNQNEKRTFCEYVIRYHQLELREQKVRALWNDYSDEHPFISLFKMRRFNHILKKIYEMKQLENQKGYNQ